MYIVGNQNPNANQYVLTKQWADDTLFDNFLNFVMMSSCMSTKLKTPYNTSLQL